MKITIDNNGTITIQVEGAAGKNCIEFTRPFEQASGEVEKRELTEDYYRDEKDMLDISELESI